MRLGLQSLLALDLHGAVHDDGMGRGLGSSAMQIKIAVTAAMTVLFLDWSSQGPSWFVDTVKKTSMASLFKSAAGMGLPESSGATRGKAHAGDSQKKR